MLEDITVFIPALKKQVVFQDDLVKKLGGVTLVQRAINRAMELRCGRGRIHVLTDSDEIRLIAERNEVQCFYDPSLVFDAELLGGSTGRYLHKVTASTPMVVLLSPYSPLLPADLVAQAIDTLAMAEEQILTPVVAMAIPSIGGNGGGAAASIFSTEHSELEVPSGAFTLFKSCVLHRPEMIGAQVLNWKIGNEYPGITSFRDWWVCEKLIKRKRILFRVIGNEMVGMGHIYRALSLAHEIADHEVLFVADTENAIAANKLAGYDYWLETYSPEAVVDRIIALKPDLVINDILSTSVLDVVPLQEEGIRVMNFEDLGEGAALADLTVNELYDDVQIEGDNILWGHKYFFLRDEFHDAHVHRFRQRVSDVLITFGGTDQHDLSRKVFLAVNEICMERDIRIHIAIGAGYAGYDRLAELVGGFDHVSLTRSTGVISRIMEQCQLAITSNGRTVYELAHMHIPSIVISQHDREKTHAFACEQNGFLSIGLYSEGKSEKAIVSSFVRLLDEEHYRHELFNRTTRFDFSRNKKKVVDLLHSLLYQGSRRDEGSIRASESEAW